MLLGSSQLRAQRAAPARGRRPFSAARPSRRCAAAAPPAAAVQAAAAEDKWISRSVLPLAQQPAAAQ
jgi:hypothetical protein